MTRDSSLRLMHVQEIFALVPGVEKFFDNGWIRREYFGMDSVWVTETKYPGGHFGTYFGAMDLRLGAYKNPVIQLLYYLHELRHAQTIRYSGDHTRSWHDWQRDIIESELVSSLTSECNVYLRIPGLRAASFSHEIWVDRFLPLLRYLPVWAVERYIRRERLRALHAPTFNDFIERQIANYRDQNFRWAHIWGEDVGYGAFADMPAFRVVEAHMASPESRNTNLHALWLEAVSHPATGIPFAHQAAAFEAVYKESNKNYGNQHLLK